MKIETMTKTLGYLTLIIVAAMVGAYLNKPNYEIPEHYKREFKESQERIETLQQDVKETRILKEIIKQRYEKDSISIFNASDSKIDSMFTDFINSIE